ncbi:PD-(D/E)XK nuclease family protein [Kitasatospora sp. NPDC004289]
MDELDRIERGSGFRRSWLHDGVRNWTDHAVAGYLRTFPQGGELVPARQPWVYDHELREPDEHGVRRVRITVWGRCFRSPDGAVRELRWPVNRSDSREKSRAELALAALVVAEGEASSRAERVRIVRFGMADGSTEVLFDGDRDAALALYREHGRPALAALLAAEEYRPGTACVGCVYSAVCPALPKAPGLLGVQDRERPRRSWSATNGRSYAACPAQYYLRARMLPVDRSVEYAGSPERGRAVHAWLAARHGPDGSEPCEPDVVADWDAGGHELALEEREVATAMLRQHAKVCPRRTVGEWRPRVEPKLAHEDTDADVVVLAEPDLLYLDGDSWVWRETKTTITRRRDRDPLLAYPQLALGVVLLARGELGGSPFRSRVELETLRPDGADLEILDPLTPEVLAMAERVLRSGVAPWHGDDRFEAKPGEGCRRCEVGRWCSARDSGAVAR